MNRRSRYGKLAFAGLAVAMLALGYHLGSSERTGEDPFAVLNKAEAAGGVFWETVEFDSEADPIMVIALLIHDGQNERPTQTTQTQKGYLQVLRDQTKLHHLHW